MAFSEKLDFNPSSYLACSFLIATVPGKSFDYQVIFFDAIFYHQVLPEDDKFLRLTQWTYPQAILEWTGLPSITTAFRRRARRPNIYAI